MYLRRTVVKLFNVQWDNKFNYLILISTVDLRSNNMCLYVCV